MLGNSIPIDKAKIFTLFLKSQQKSIRGLFGQNPGPTIDSDYPWPHKFIYVISFKIRVQIDSQNSISYFSKTWQSFTKFYFDSHDIDVKI